jgi:hypothetical protein
MFDDLQHLRDDPSLFHLLNYYVQDGAADREAWQDRLMQLDEAPAGDLVQWHGELLAYGWIEQNTGTVSILRPGTVPQCYRPTTAGQRAIRRVRAHCDAEDDGGAA